MSGNKNGKGKQARNRSRSRPRSKSNGRNRSRSRSRGRSNSVSFAGNRKVTQSTYYSNAAPKTSRFDNRLQSVRKNAASQIIAINKSGREIAVGTSHVTKIQRNLDPKAVAMMAATFTLWCSNSGYAGKISGEDTNIDYSDLWMAFQRMIYDYAAGAEVVSIEMPAPMTDFFGLVRPKNDIIANNGVTYQYAWNLDGYSFITTRFNVGVTFGPAGYTGTSSFFNMTYPINGNHTVPDWNQAIAIIKEALSACSNDKTKWSTLTEKTMQYNPDLFSYPQQDFEFGKWPMYHTRSHELMPQSVWWFCGMAQYKSASVFSNITKTCFNQPHNVLGNLLIMSDQYPKLYRCKNVITTWLDWNQVLSSVISQLLTGNNKKVESGETLDNNLWQGNFIDLLLVNVVSTCLQYYGKQSHGGWGVYDQSNGKCSVKVGINLPSNYNDQFDESTFSFVNACLNGSSTTYNEKTGVLRIVIPTIANNFFQVALNQVGNYPQKQTEILVNTDLCNQVYVDPISGFTEGLVWKNGRLSNEAYTIGGRTQNAYSSIMPTSNLSHGFPTGLSQMTQLIRNNGEKVTDLDIQGFAVLIKNQFLLKRKIHKNIKECENDDDDYYVKTVNFFNRKKKAWEKLNVDDYVGAMLIEYQEFGTWWVTEDIDRDAVAISTWGTFNKPIATLSTIPLSNHMKIWNNAIIPSLYIDQNSIQSAGDIEELISLVQSISCSGYKLFNSDQNNYVLANTYNKSTASVNDPNNSNRSEWGNFLQNIANTAADAAPPGLRELLQLGIKGIRYAFDKDRQIKQRRIKEGIY